MNNFKIKLIILVVLGLAVLGLLGWKVYQHEHHATSNMVLNNLPMQSNNREKGAYMLITDTLSNGSGMMHNGRGMGMMHGDSSGMMMPGGMGMMGRWQDRVEPTPSTGDSSYVGNWVAPAWADTLKNPLNGNKKAIAKGKTIYANTCALCHGDRGKGDGPVAGALNPHPANLASANVQQQSDGAIFWKITTGKPPMAAYKASLSKEQRWEVVDYLRQLKEKKDK